MIKTLTAHTEELDDVSLAVSEILEQLNLDKNLLKNAVGFITCHSDFVQTGVVDELCKQLPFSTVGATTLSTAVPDEMGQLMLGISVLTSDDVSFSAAATESLTPDNLSTQIETAYKRAAAVLPGQPSLIITFAPLGFNIAGDHVVDMLDKASNQTPIFGTLAVDHTTDYHTAQTIFNGKTYRDALSLVVFSGPVNPAFSIESVSDEKILGQKAIITSSQGNILQGVNDVSVIEYLQSIGLAPNKKIDGLNVIPFILDFNDGTKPVARAMFALTPEGYAVCGGIMPVNTTLGIGSIDHDEVIATTKKSITKIAQSNQNNGLIIFSCVVRNIVLGFDVMAEMETVRDILGAKTPYIMSYSGGEICPVPGENGKLVNRFHNDTIITCSF
ncbi:hypothetical protein AAIR98_001564 [Elusimicrobium simillimum]|uniref:FIST N-terminal domain-containing protein n=1 Tax=Elusimicrobium simillimum TaxID=3143438 RepID=UPI003C702E89